MKSLPRPIKSAIVAMAKGRVIGNHNQLPWHLPADLMHFKNITTGHPIVMGRKTYESIGRPLPNRTNLIMTRNHSFHAAGCITVSSIEEVLKEPSVMESNEVFIIGGANIYQLWLPYLERIYLTLVLHDVIGDAYFPELNIQEWREMTREKHWADERNPYDYDFICLERIDGQATLNRL